MDQQSKSALIKQKATELGFQSCGIAHARRLDEEEEHFKNYLESNYNGKMGYMANHFEKRLDPTKLVPGAKSVVVVLLNYSQGQMQTGTDVPLISKYAYGKDYHLVVKEKLRNLFNYINDEIGTIEGRVFTDSAPVLERSWAVQAGLGWIGKNGLLLNKELGSFFVIGELIIDMELDYDAPFKGEYCGSCNQCLSACPTKALVKPYILDARKCISYLTIELKDQIPEQFQSMLHRRVFGCDICQDVCPWNRKAKKTNEQDFRPHPDFLKMNKEDWVNLSKEQFNVIFKQSALKWAGYQKLMQNISIINEEGE
jgi:epoxyqueuosine reductase